MTGAEPILESVADVGAKSALAFFRTSTSSTRRMTFGALISVSIEAKVADAVFSIVGSVGIAGPADSINLEETSLASAFLPVPCFVLLAGLTFIIDQIFASNSAHALKAVLVPL